MPAWKSRGHLEDHFARHGPNMGIGSVGDYERSSRATAAVGEIFGYRDRMTGDWHVGYYDPVAGRFTGTDEDGWIVTHFRCDQRYMRDLWESEYR